MEDIISAIKSNDLVKAKRAFNAIMLERTSNLIESRKIDIARSIIIEGEEPEDDEEDEDEKDSKSEKDKESKDKKESEDEDDEDED